MKACSPKQKRQRSLFRFKGALTMMISLTNFWLIHDKYLSDYECVSLKEVEQNLQDILDRWDESREEK